MTTSDRKHQGRSCSSPPHSSCTDLLSLNFESLKLCSRLFYFYLSAVALPLFFPMSRPLPGVPVLIGWLEEVSTWPPAGVSETAAAKKRGGNELIFSSPGPPKQQKHRTDQTYWNTASSSLITAAAKRKARPHCYLKNKQSIEVSLL